MKTITLTQSGTYSYTLEKEGSELSVTGAFWLKNQDKLDLNLTIIHAAPHTKATATLKVVAEGASQAHLHGTVIVRPQAQDTNSFLEERVLILSDHARAEAIPNLEIEANDVKCSHAATIGKIDEEQLFYLESRGLPKQKATHLIAKGFLGSLKNINNT